MDVQEIKERLTSIIDDLDKARREYESKRMELSMEEMNLKVKQSSLWLETKTNSPKSTQKDLEAQVDILTQTQQAKAILAEGSTRAAYLDLERLKDEYDSLKKQCNILDAELRIGAA